MNQREELAELCHDQWSGWMKHLFGKMIINKNGEWEMPHEFVARWHRQMNTLYPHLPGYEQDSDRKEADRFLKLINRVGEKLTSETAHTGEKDKIKKWLNIYPNNSPCAHDTRENADGSAMVTRIACIEIEYCEGEGLK